MELVNSIQLLAGTHELDRLVHHGTDRQGGTTTGITIQLGQYDTVEIQTFVELTGGIHGILTGHGIYNKQCFIRIDGVLDGLDFIHHLLIDGQTTGGIDNHQVISFCLGFLDGMQSNLNRILTIQLTINRYLHLLTQHLQLFDSGRTVYVTSYQQRLAVLLGLEHTGQLTGERSLTGTLQTGHQDNGRTVLQLDFGGIATHQLGQFIVYNLHHQLARLHRRKYVLSQGLLLYRICKAFSNFIVHIGIQQGTTHIFQGLRNIDFGNLTFTFQYLERPF